MSFVDADDFIENNFFEVLDKKIGDRADLDLLRVTTKKITTDGNIKKIESFEEKEFSGEEAFLKCRIKKIELDLPWSYCIKTAYWKQNKVKFPEGRLHEDFATMPMLLLRAKKVLFINGTYYVQILSDNSTIRTNDYSKILKKSYDILYNYDDLKEQLEGLENISLKSKKVFLEFISTAVFQQLNNLNEEDREKYKEEIKKRKIIKNIRIYKGCVRRIIMKKIYFRIMLIK